jgi:hypothetical protein
MKGRRTRSRNQKPQDLMIESGKEERILPRISQMTWRKKGRTNSRTQTGRIMVRQNHAGGGLLIMLFHILSFRTGGNRRGIHPSQQIQIAEP